MTNGKIDVVPGIIMALSGAGATWGGLKLSRRGQRDDAQQSEAAHALAERVQRSHEMESLVDRLERALERADKELLDERTENDRRAHEQANRCRVALHTALEHVHTLQSILHDEMAPIIEATAREEVEIHEAEDHVDDTEPMEEP